MTALDLAALAIIFAVVFILASLGERCINYLYPPQEPKERASNND